MKTVKIARTDLEVSRMAYGCGSLASLTSPKPPVGGDHTKEEIDRFKDDHSEESIVRFSASPPERELVDAADRVINSAIDEGITLFDHADIYGFGKCEELFGVVLAKSPGMRDRVVIQTKCGIMLSESILAPKPGHPHHLDLSGDHIVQSAEKSLRRLGTDRIDILLLHRPDALVEPEEVARAFDQLHESGKVRHFGVSNHTPLQIELLRKHVRQPFVVNQIQVGLAYAQLIADGVQANQDDTTRMMPGYTGVAGTLDYCRLHDIQVQAWAPMKGSDMVGPPILLGPPKNASPEALAAAALVAEKAREKGVAPSALMLAWLLRHPAGIVPVIGPTKTDHLRQNCAADGVELSRAEWYELFAAAAGVPTLQLLGVVLPKELA